MIGTFLLHEFLDSVKSPLDELSRATQVVIEIPSKMVCDFERRLLPRVVSANRRNCDVLIVVAVDYRAKTPQCQWVSRWNDLKGVPCKFVRTCSCLFKHTTPGCHLAYYIASSGIQVPVGCST